MRKVIGIGETILDIIFRDNQPYAAVPGGSVFNGLTSLGRMGLPVLFISELGDDHVGGLIRAFMEENNISTDYVDRYMDGKSPISLAFLDKDNNANYAFYKNYPAQRLDVPLPPIEKDDIFIYGSYYALNPALRERMVEFLRYAQERGAILYYDPNFRKAHAHEAIQLKPTILENLEFADIVRGSDEDFVNIFGEKEPRAVYKEHVEFYCDNFITTRGRDGVDLFTRRFEAHYPARAIETRSTIGAGDNFNAGIIFGLLREGIGKADLSNLGQADWAKIIGCGIDLSSEVCQSYDNYVSREFAKRYVSQS